VNYDSAGRGAGSPKVGGGDLLVDWWTVCSGGELCCEWLEEGGGGRDEMN